jgi:hypothetical protein
MKKVKILIILGICLILSALGIIYLRRYEIRKDITEKKKQAMELVKKVEEYKKMHHKIPAYQDDLGDFSNNYPIYYNTTKDSGVYIVSFQIAPFKSMGYHSDTKAWTEQ